MPSTVANAVLTTWSGQIWICSYALDMLSFVWYLQCATLLQMRSWSSKGVTSFIVFSFCRCRLKTVHSVPFFFGTHSIGTIWYATAGIHHFTVVYHSNFKDNFLWKCSGHFSSQYWMCLLGSIRLISWTSCRGRSSSGILLTRSAIFSIHSSWSWGRSSFLWTMTLCEDIGGCLSCPQGSTLCGIFLYFLPPSSSDECVLPCLCGEEVEVNLCGVHLPGINVSWSAEMWFASLSGCGSPLMPCCCHETQSES